MSIRTFLIAIIIAMISISIFTDAQAQADIIITNGTIVTLDDSNPRIEAVAIKRNKIVAAGTLQKVLKCKGRKTIIIDAKGKTIVPGLFDSHLHVIRGGRFYNSELRWDGVKSLDRALTMLKEQSERTPEGQWVRVVGGWSEYQFKEKRLPTIEEINGATGHTPAFILYLYGKAWLNKAGLEKLNITGDSPNPPGGLIQKDNNGIPTGLLIAEPNAFILYATLARLPELSTEEQINSTRQFMTELNRLGVTGAMDAGGGFQNFPDDYHITETAFKEGKLTLRLPYFLFAQKKSSELNDFSKWTAMIDIAHRHDTADHAVDYYVQGGGENLVGDAADFENFLFPRPELPPAMENNLERVLQLLVKNRWPFRLHATYNESITRDLDVIEKVNQETPLNGLVWFFDHAETITEENLRRIKSLGGGICIQHRMAYQGESFVHRYGRTLAGQAPPVKKILEFGIPVALGTDGTRVASYNPWMAIYWITTGKTVGGTQVLSRDNIIDRVTALKLFSTGGYQLIKHKQNGKIREGYHADLILLSDDYFSIPEESIPDITSLLTIVDGKIVWGDGAFSHYAPGILPVLPSWSPVRHYGGYQRN